MIKVSKVFSGPLTSIGENRRQEQQDKTASPSLFETIREIDAIIYKIHEEKLLVKAYGAETGTAIANDNWIPLAHSPQEIAERFGTIRPGMVARVSYQGADGVNARATIIYNEKEKTGEEDFAMNELETGLYEIFKPGT